MTESFAKGDLDRRAEITGRDEINRLRTSFNSMAEQLDESVKELTRLSRVASGTQNMVIITDPAGKIEWVNDAYIRNTGYTLEECVGVKPGALLQGPLTNPTIIQEIREKLNRQEGFKAELINYNKLGNPYWVEIEVQPIHNDHGELINFIAIESDITSRREADEKIRKYAIELERSNRELQDFAYIASHDLQEPLRKIQAFGSRVQSRYANALDERGNLYLNSMQNAANRMQLLIQNLLEFSRVSTQAKPNQAVDLDHVIHSVIEDLEIRINETQGQVISEKLGTIEGDPVQIRQVLQNLIGNALKFARDEVPPVVHITGQQIYDQSAGRMLEITIKDNGIGFDNKYKEKIFQIFQRLHGRDAYQGTGVGLAITKKIIERHSGTISADGADGEGAMFTIQLPITQPTEET